MVLGDLTESQRQLAMTMLEEETESSSQDDDDMGRIEGLQLNLELSDTTPVQKIAQFPVPCMLKLNTTLKICSTGDG